MPGFCRFLAILSVWALVAPAAAEDDGRPNVLLILADDLNTCLHCYGHPLASSPRLDRLAAEGVRFDRAYTQSPLCNPSRVSLLTGRYPSSTGVRANREYFRDRMPDLVTLPEYFRTHGYVTARVGKIFHNGLDDERSWNEGGTAGRTRERRSRAHQEAYSERSDHWEALEGEGLELKDYKNASTAIALLRKLEDQPFFIALGLTSTHTPLVAPKPYFDLHPPQEFSLPPDFATEVTLLPGMPEGMRRRNGDLFVARSPTEAQAKQAIAAYYATVSFLDAQVGRVLDELGRLGLEKKTIVVFTSDHGFHLGEKGRWSKHDSFFEPALRVPLIVSAPGAARGAVSRRIVELVDLYPTLVALADLPRPSGLDGENFSVLLRDPDAPWGFEAYSAGWTSGGFATSVRDERYRYTEWDGGRAGALLTDFEVDPLERVNRIDDPDSSAALEHLRQRLHTTLR